MTSHFHDHAFLCSINAKDNEFVIDNMNDVIPEENLKSSYGINVKIISTENKYGEKVKSSVPLLD